MNRIRLLAGVLAASGLTGCIMLPPPPMPYRPPPPGFRGEGPPPMSSAAEGLAVVERLAEIEAALEAVA